jgi:hypothetical protein
MKPSSGFHPVTWERVTHAFDPQKKDQHHNSIECLQQLKEACEQIKH